MSVRLVKAPISLKFSLAHAEDEVYEREFQRLSMSDEDPITQWLKLAKAKGDSAETDPVLLNLLVELHRKIDSLERTIKNEEPNRLDLESHEMIETIGFGYFDLAQSVLVLGRRYYGRIEMPVYPKRDIAVFFTAESSSLAKIEKMHEADEKEWASYLTARERILIRENKRVK